MSSEPLLTIGIPTFNRAAAIAARVQELGEIADKLDIAVVISDNASTDDTAARLAAPGPRVRVVRNETNLGYARNLFRVVDETETPFLTIVSDEDRVNAEGLAALLEFCRSRRPRMVSPRAQVGSNTAYRGRRATAEMSAVDYQPAAFYVSGLTFDTEEVKRSVALVRKLVPDNSAATVYPQVLLSALAVARGNSFFLDELVTTQMDVLETHITEGSGSSYTTVAGRWAQFLGYEAFFDLDLEPEVGTAGVARIRQMRENSREGVLGLLLKSAAVDLPAITPYFQRSALRFGLGGITRRIRRR